MIFAALGVLGFVLNVTSGLRYTRVSADILFDMRLSLYEHLQRLSPRFYARTRLGDIIARINGDIGEIQRVAAEAALAWVGNVLFLAGSLAMMVWLDWRLSLVALAMMPISLWALVHYRRRLEKQVADLRQRSADIGSFLIETLQANTLVVTSNAQSRETARFRRLNDAFVSAVMGMQRISYFAGGLPGMLLSVGSAIVFLYGGSRVIDGTLSLGTFGAFLAYQMRVFASGAGADGPLREPGDRARVVAARARDSRRAGRRRSNRRAAMPLERPRRASPSNASASRPSAAGRSWTTSASRRGPGQSLAIVGASGSGKSTIALLATRLLDPDAGAVRLDGHDLRSIGLAAIRGQSCSSSRSRCCCTPRLRRTSATRSPTPATTTSAARRPPRASRRSSKDCRRATRRWSASAARRCPQASVSASRWRARFSPILPCSCSTNRPRRSIRSPSGT